MSEMIYTAETENEAVDLRCYTVGDLRKILGISKGSVYALLKRQEFKWFRIGGIYRISKKSFDAWLDEQ